MKTLLVLVISVVLCLNVKGLENLMNTDMQKCLNCLCHARSGCWSRFNCARYSVSFEYWQLAGSPTVTDSSDLRAAYDECMKNENCILNTINNYTGRLGDIDCNCDGAFDCKDRLAVHLFGENCRNPAFGDIYASRFNDCYKELDVRSAMTGVEANCDVEVF